MKNFSVLMSVYAREQSDYLKVALRSIFAQTVLPTEIVLVKDGPLTQELDDVIADFCEKYDSIKVVKIAKNAGLGNALNVGLAACANDLVARMDSDDLSFPKRFEAQLQIFDKDPNVDVVGAWIDEFEKDTSNIVSTRKLPENHKDIFQYAKSRCPVNHPVVMFKKQSVLDAGGYQHFPLFEDYYLWVRMLMNGAKFYNIQESLLYFRCSPDMYKRRGGLKYAIDECRFQNTIQQMQFINPQTCLKNISIRFTTRILPNCLRTILYKKALRK